MALVSIRLRCVRACESFFRLKAQLIRRTQDLCVESSDMTETKYDSTYSVTVHWNSVTADVSAGNSDLQCKNLFIKERGFIYTVSQKTHQL